MVQHAATCPLYPTHWLRFAVATTGLLLQDPPDPGGDRISAMMLTDALAHLAELPNWETVTLKDVVDQVDWVESSPNREWLRSQCTCGALDG
ncbi:hypothetical protein [Streptomyces sp. rh34]|uniref:hypothetical protein n=1 Tax=Streptomyces sp. rh34 TaxID=2034272 RepID=UPI000BF18D3E|nr:hypothetical protein [Streptomyces sp. rh34]